MFFIVLGCCNRARNTLDQVSREHRRATSILHENICGKCGCVFVVCVFVQSSTGIKYSYPYLMYAVAVLLMVAVVGPIACDCVVEYKSLSAVLFLVISTLLSVHLACQHRTLAHVVRGSVLLHIYHIIACFITLWHIIALSKYWMISSYHISDSTNTFIFDILLVFLCALSRWRMENYRFTNLLISLMSLETLMTIVPLCLLNTTSSAWIDRWCTFYSLYVGGSVLFFSRCLLVVSVCVSLLCLSSITFAHIFLVDSIHEIICTHTHTYTCTYTYTYTYHTAIKSSLPSSLWMLEKAFELLCVELVKCGNILRVRASVNLVFCLFIAWRHLDIYIQNNISEVCHFST